MRGLGGSQSDCLGVCETCVSLSLMLPACWCFSSQFATDSLLNYDFVETVGMKDDL